MILNFRAIYCGGEGWGAEFFRKWCILPRRNFIFYARKFVTVCLHLVYCSSGFYHDPNAGWYYSTSDGLYYKFENGNYVQLESVQVLVGFCSFVYFTSSLLLLCNWCSNLRLKMKLVSVPILMRILIRLCYKMESLRLMIIIWKHVKINQTLVSLSPVCF